MNIKIKIENLSKGYKRGQIGTTNFVEDSLTTIGSFFGLKEKKGNANHFWALKNLNLEISEGEIVGVVGKNGAGKSTLLKILSRVTAPTSGKININGRVSSLLEVGSGFHPELTGLENIYLNGAILGMKRREINSKLKDIIEFSGIGNQIDTPVKRYSSGMTVRLGFAVSAFLESEILILDEVLAVGDYEFQQRCLSQVNSEVKKGRTCIIVTHNMQIVSAKATRCILLEGGELIQDGKPSDVISNYLDRSIKRVLKGEYEVNGFKLRRVLIDGKPSFESSLIASGSGLKIGFEFESSREYDRVIPGVIFESQTGEIVVYHHGGLDNFHLQMGNISEVTFEIHKLALVTGLYYVSCGLVRDGVILSRFDNVCRLNVIGSKFYHNGEEPPAGLLYNMTQGTWSVGIN